VKYKCFLFDFDFTLAKPTKGVVISVNYALSKIGLPQLSGENICKVVGYPLQDTFEMLVGNQFFEKKQEYLRYFKEKADEVMTENTELLSDVDVLLNTLAQKGIKVGIISNKYRYRIIQFLERERITDKIQIIIGSEDLLKPKPDPEGIHTAIEILGLLKENILYIGDSIVDAQFTQRGKIDFGAILTGMTKKEEFKDYKVNYFFTDNRELIKWINN
jgi:phosphoglycolate phosphatase